MILCRIVSAFTDAYCIDCEQKASNLRVNTFTSFVVCHLVPSIPLKSSSVANKKLLSDAFLNFLIVWKEKWLKSIFQLKGPQLLATHAIPSFLATSINEGSSRFFRREIICKVYHLLYFCLQSTVQKWLKTTWTKIHCVSSINLNLMPYMQLLNA